MKYIKEDAAVNNASSGEVAGLDNNPPVGCCSGNKKKNRDPRVLRQILKRKVPNA